jgi:hypothetical protein
MTDSNNNQSDPPSDPTDESLFVEALWELQAIPDVPAWPWIFDDNPPPGSLGAQLSAITRKAFVPSVYQHLFYGSPPPSMHILSRDEYEKTNPKPKLTPKQRELKAKAAFQKLNSWKNRG